MDNTRDKANNIIREQLSDALLYLFNTGKLYHAYRTFGAHILPGGVSFTVWAPDVRSVRVVGDFNDWGRSGDSGHMECIGDSGVWNGFVEGAGAGTLYKYDIESASGIHSLKADPFAFGAEVRPDTASAVTELLYEWNDTEWMEARESYDSFTSPLNIYELHLGSWRRHEDNCFYTYREIAQELIPYVREMGYSHIELLPVMEHPLDASWGYQVTGYYAPTSRYGHPLDFKYLIDECHRAGIGVILDWVPGHFCPDSHGLAQFNGSKLYESVLHPDWGTYKFDFSRNQVRSFLLSNAMFWLDEYHADGIRVDGVTSMLYLNFGISDRSRFRMNSEGGDTDTDAEAFLKEFNTMVGTSFPGVFTAAEESSAWPLVTAPPQDGGLGFHYKWNMGWMNDTLAYMQKDFMYRSSEHNRLTFSMAYAYSENYILPLSHDEVVHGKLSLIGRMPGDIWRKFAGARMLALYQLTHPGKKLSFMGHEIAQFIEWREYEQLEWFLLGYENHRRFREFIRDLNHVYLDNPALWRDDNTWNGFRWIDPDNSSQNIYSYIRMCGGKHDVAALSEAGSDKTADACDAEAKQLLVTVINTGVQAFDEFRLGVPEKGLYKELINSDSSEYAGSGRTNPEAVDAEAVPAHGMPYSIAVRMPVVGGMILKKIPEQK